MYRTVNHGLYLTLHAELILTKGGFKGTHDRQFSHWIRDKNKWNTQCIMRVVLLAFLLVF